MVVFSPLAYPGYNWMTMAVCVAVAGMKSKVFRWGIYLYAAMEWLCNVGYTCFPWVAGADSSHF